jgi:hypothetical protein
VRRCCAGINSEAIGNGADTTPPAPRPVNSRRMIICSAFCTSGISKVKNVVAVTPISMMVLRLRRSPTAENAKPLTVSVAGGPKSSQRLSASVRCNGALASTNSEPVITKS